MAHGRRARAAACLALGVAAASTLTGAALPVTAAPAAARALVVTAPGPISAAALRAALPSTLRVERVDPIRRGLADIEVSASAALPMASVMRLLVDSGAVTSASPDTRFAAQGAKAPVAAADTHFGDQWALWDAGSSARAGGYGIDAPRAWQVTTGASSQTIAVLDTGITDHPNLKGMRRVGGWDFVTSGEATVGDDDPTDTGDACASTGGSTSSWHGTFVTSEIAAQPGAGIAGVAPGVSVEPIRVLGPCGGSESATIRGLLWAAGLPVQATDDSGNTVTVPGNAHPASVISMSLGGSGLCDDAMQSAVDAAVQAGAVVVVAAGNDGGPIANSSPADCAGVVSVVATGRHGTVASYSDTGSDAMPATIAAPGGDTVQQGSGYDLDDLVLGDSWSDQGAYTGLLSHATLQYDAGTSMATPLVSASIALLRSRHPELTPAQVVAELQATATPFPAAARCTTARCGAGIVNVGNLLGAPKRFLLAAAPAVSGGARVGAVLVAHPGVWRSSPSSTSYQWWRNGRLVHGQTGAKYRVKKGDRGQRIFVRVTVKRSGTATASAASKPVRIAG